MPCFMGLHRRRAEAPMWPTSTPNGVVKWGGVDNWVRTVSGPVSSSGVQFGAQCGDQGTGLITLDRVPGTLHNMDPLEARRGPG